MDLGLQSRIAIVTGSSQGIGKAIAYGLACEGIKVTICARNEVRLKHIAKDLLLRTGTEVFFVKTDFNKKKAVQSIVKQTVKKYGQIDIY